MEKHYPFQPEPLPYDYNALEPYIDEKTLYFHHDKHYTTYVENLNKALAQYTEYHSWPLKDLLTKLSELPEPLRTPVRRNGGGVYNHELYFNGMSKESKISPCMENWICEQFVSLDKWKEQMSTAALSVFGSGYALFVLDSSKQLKIITTANQDTPLSLNITPLLLIDVWEHAYYLKYQNRRNDYAEQWYHIINWKHVEMQLIEM